MVCLAIADVPGDTTEVTVPVNYLSHQIRERGVANPRFLKDGETYYLYVGGEAGENGNIDIYRSGNVIDWEYVGEAFAANLIDVPGKKKWENPAEDADYTYYHLWGADVIKTGSQYAMVFNATQVEEGDDPFAEDSWKRHTCWIAWADSPEGPFGPSGTQRPTEPLPFRNYRWGFTGTKPHSATLHGGDLETLDWLRMRIDPSFHVEGDDVWLLYTSNEWYAQNLEFVVAMVKLEPSDLSLTHLTAYEHIRLTDPSQDQMPVDNLLVTEAPAIIQRNGKYIMFYSVNPYDAPTYSIKYRMANTLQGLAWDQGPQEGYVLDGSASQDYSYGAGDLVAGPSGQQWLHVFTVMKSQDEFYRSLWVIEQEFNPDGSPKAIFPDESSTVTIRLPSAERDRQERKLYGGYPVRGDYDGDGRDDLAVFRDGVWYIQTTNSEAIAWNLSFGFVGGMPVCGDYNGDGTSDLATFDREGGTGNWQIQTLAGTSLATDINWGYSGTVAVPGDYNGDGKSDLAIYDSSSHMDNWYVATLLDHDTLDEVLAWGLDWGFPGADPVSGDYNADGTDDLAVFASHPPEHLSNWYVLALSGSIIDSAVDFGFWGARTVQGNFGGDARDDYAVYTEGHWYAATVGGNPLFWDESWGSVGTRVFPGDYDGNGTTDLAFFTPSKGEWSIISPDGTDLPRGIALADVNTVGIWQDFAGDNRSDLVVYVNGEWSIRTSDGRIRWEITHGNSSHQCVPGDYDGDGFEDLAVYNQWGGTANWFIRRLTGGTPLADGNGWGYPGTVPVPGDYNGDGKSDLAVYDTAQGIWYVKLLPEAVWVWGIDLIQPDDAGFQPVSGNYDGLGGDDLAAYNPNTRVWKIKKRVDWYNGTWIFNDNFRFGPPGAVPVPGDYDGDGTDDLALYYIDYGDPERKAWWTIKSVDGRTIADAEQWGNAQTVPKAGDYDGDGKSDLAVYWAPGAKWAVRRITGEIILFE